MGTFGLYAVEANGISKAPSLLLFSQAERNWRRYSGRRDRGAHVTVVTAAPEGGGDVKLVTRIMV